MNKGGFEIYEGKTIEQIVSHCGDGKLKDGGDTQKELRDYLAGCDIKTLKRHTEECLKENKFDARGFVLQDIVNTLAKRLELKVEHGRYRGTQRDDDNGVDGVWKTDDHAFVVEVKTTDTYRMNLNTISDYRDNLLQNQKIKNNNSLLLVMGDMSKDENLVAQVRGLPRAWDTRIITVGSLIQLVELKVEESSGLNLDYFYKVLKPFDYICVDGLVTLLNDIVSDVSDTEEDDILETEEKTRSIQKTNDSHRKRVLKTIETMHGGNLVQKGRTRFENSKTGELFFISFSKKHREKQNAYYWYTYNYNPSNKCDFLALYTKEPKDWFYLIPVETIEKLADEGKLNFNDQENFRRVHIAMDMNKGEMMLRLKKGHDKESLEKYKFSLVS